MRDDTDDRRGDDRSLPVSRRGVLRGAAGAAGAAALGGLSTTTAANEGEETHLFRIRVENVSVATDLPTPVSPGAYAVHDRGEPFFTGFEPASDGLERLAEDGMPGDLASEAESRGESVRETGVFAIRETVADPNDPTGEVPGAPPVFPGGAFEFTVAAAPGESLSFATMLVQSNDLFLSPDVTGISLYDGGEPITGDVSDQVSLWEAGTEVDQEPGAGDDQAPRQDDVDTGADENGLVLPTAAAYTGGEYPDADDVLSVTVEPVETQSLQVRVENVASTDTYGGGPTDGAVWITPGGVGVHRGHNPVFTEGEPASAGLELLAEAGPPSDLVPELAEGDRVDDVTAYTPDDTLADPNDPTGEVPGAPPIAPGGAFEFTVDAAPGQYLSFASMFVPSNDLFLSPDAGGVPLFEDGDPVVADLSDHVDLWDAGTEPNGKPGEDPDQAPAQDAADQGGDEGGVVRHVDDVDDGYFYPDTSDALRLTVAPPGEDLPSRAFRVRVENVAPTDFYGADASTGGAIWITPGAFAVHPGPNPIFREGHPASPGLRLLAEAGPPSDLVPELRSNARVEAAGAYTPDDTVADPNDPTGEVPGAPPIAPGGAFEFDVEASPGHRLSFASMFVPSNDLFLSPEFGAISLFDDGDPVSGDVTAGVGLWDAGTEPNAEPPGFGPDQAPAQDSATQGADEGGVVRAIADVDDGHDYPAVEDVLTVSVTPL